MNAKEPASDNAATPGGRNHYAPAEFGPVNHWWHFTDVTLEAGFDYEHGYNVGGCGPNPRPGCRRTERQNIAGGVAAGDFDDDGLVDLYVIRGTIGANLLFRNRGFSKRQLREIRARSNFASQDPAEAHFGLGRLPFARRVEVRWPDGEVSVRQWVPANSSLLIAHPSLD